MTEIVLRYVVMVVIAVLIVLLVLTGHNGDSSTQIIAAAFSFIVGVLFRDTVSKQNKLAQDNKDNGTN